MEETRTRQTSNPRKVKMTHHRPRVEMLALRFGYFPKVFMYKGQRIVVNHVVRCWNVSAKNPRFVFLVECGDKEFQLNHHTLSGEWTIDEVTN